MEPTALELESSRVARLLIYVYSQLNTEPPEELPFNLDDLVKAGQSYGLPPQYLDIAVKELCLLRRSFTKRQENTILYDGRNPQARELADWWDKHEEADNQRLMENARKIEALHKQIDELQAEIKRLERDE